VEEWYGSMEGVGVMVNKEFWNGKKVLVTGHTGFKGSWLSIWLKELGAEVIGYSLDPYSQLDNFVLTNLKNEMIDIRGDIRDYKKLLDVFSNYQPEIIFHLAAQPLVRLSYELPKETYDINVGGTVNVLEAIRNTDSAKAAVLITTDKCYENKEWVWGYRENDPMGGYDPYSSSKGAAELVIAGYRNSFFNPEKFNQHGKAIASARAGNVIGGGDWAKDRIVPDCIRALKSNQSIAIRNPWATRPWQHVLEPLNGYLLLANRLIENGKKYAGAWNFGPDDSSVIPVNEVVNKIIEYWGGGEWMDLSNPNDLHEANLLSLDCIKAKTFLKWQPALSIDEAIRLTVEWYKNYENNDVYEICRNQINVFQDMINSQKPRQKQLYKSTLQLGKKQLMDQIKEVASSSE
jgi:CDP-glucose 4,6-dehydratase